MAGSSFRGLIGILAAGSMLFSATAATATAATGPAAPAPQQISPWVALTALSGGAPAAALCGAAATTAAAQAPAAGCVLPALDAPVPAAPPPPPPPVPAVAPAEGYGISPILLGLVAVAGALAFYLLVKNHHNHANSPT